MRRYPLYIFDLDGTLYRGEWPIDGAAETVGTLRGGGAQIRFLTNNSSTTRATYKAKLNRLGFEASESEIYSSATGSATRLTELGVQTVFVVGEKGLIQTLTVAGLQVVNRGEDDNPTSEIVRADALLVGICRVFKYGLLNAAMQVGLKGASFCATNRDATFPLEAGALAPGAGTIVAAVATALGREPEVFGKPSPYLVDLILRDACISPADALVVGDRYDTDMVSGQRAGCDTHLVLTGVAVEPPEGQSHSADLRALCL